LPIVRFAPTPSSSDFPIFHPLSTLCGVTSLTVDQKVLCTDNCHRNRLSFVAQAALPLSASDGGIPHKNIAVAEEEQQSLDVRPPSSFLGRRPWSPVVIQRL
jgi:hypothetical protein